MTKQMMIFKTIKDVRNFVCDNKNRNRTIGFVPTMGALHDGHISLIKQAQKKADIVIVSIFVNKVQFNDNNDYKLYPRSVEADLKKLSDCAIDAVFLPEDNEIYPENFSCKISPLDLVDCLCAKIRAGHFDGVALVITKLFNIVKPDYAFFGEKDFQQFLVIKKLVADLNFDIEVFAVPTLREEGGLAMSSRNQRLSESARIKASMIYKIMNQIKINPQLIEQKKTELLKNGFEKIDYLEIRNESDLKLNNDVESSQSRRIFIAVYIEGIRLIDNLGL